MKDASFSNSPEMVGKISRKKIYFAHQSVGFNIVDGIADVVTGHPEIKLNVKETRKIEDFDHSIFSHSRIGNNTDAVGKIADFSDLINNEIGYTLDIAFLKLCYVDVTAASDIQAIFEAYRSAMEKISSIHPTLKIIHWTIPLTVSRITWKTKIKKIFGIRIWECENNVKRNQFNDLVKERYAGKQPIFDLARLESGAMEKQPASFRLQGKNIETLHPGYSDDGGHLNTLGRRVVAERLLLFLASIKL